ncbi:MAG: UDP-N-acetylmuramoyl-tripeptide--D-alanyl-D-alanine ligase, partial [Candidatus Electrothrix sp. AR3]|nr:UDP-N-acetylmuramoyl-tripeptide--D-alanyl-D-alanine ligase [Candidatus Electrothrix sp. AR3]
DDPHIARLPINSERVIGFATTSAGFSYNPTLRATALCNKGEEGMQFILHIDDLEQQITVQVPGVHNVSNCLAAAAIAHAAGVKAETITVALSAFQSGDKRMQFMRLPGAIRVLNDCYNANPSSMSAALQTVHNFGNHCKRLALLGDMLELGQNAAESHHKLGKEVAELGYDRLALIGAFAGQVQQGAEQAGMAIKNIHVFADTQAMADWLYHEIIRAKITAGDWLLVKGSRGMRMEKVLEETARRLESKTNKKKNS